MTDAEALHIYDEMVKEFGSKIPDPDHQPIQFSYYAKLFKFIRGLKSTSS